mmetsp:Transcript_33407/g.40384  ORF Transcript_33407/g.40384 Transcript_33407/m.40384 type:complete len:119 (-) Transcript_33407:970-1326(-)
MQWSPKDSTSSRASMLTLHLRKQSTPSLNPMKPTALVLSPTALRPLTQLSPATYRGNPAKGISPTKLDDINTIIHTPCAVIPHKTIPTRLYFIPIVLNISVVTSKLETSHLSIQATLL